MMKSFNVRRENRMTDFSQIRKFCDGLVRKYRPERVILFGSYANGRPGADSDVDLLVIMPHEGSDALKAAEIVGSLNPRFAVDLLVRTAEQVQRRVALNDFFLRSVLSDGKVLYEASDA